MQWRVVFRTAGIIPEIIVPEEVWHEIVDGSHLDMAAQMLP